jgi:hypothetical protein
LAIGTDDARELLRQLEPALAKLATEMTSLRKDVAAEMADLRKDIAAVRTDLSKEIALVRADVAEVRGKLSMVPNTLQMLTMIIAVFGLSFALSFALLRFAPVLSGLR